VLLGQVPIGDGCGDWGVLLGQVPIGDSCGDWGVLLGQGAVGDCPGLGLSLHLVLVPQRISCASQLWAAMNPGQRQSQSCWLLAALVHSNLACGRKRTPRDLADPLEIQPSLQLVGWNICTP